MPNEVSDTIKNWAATLEKTKQILEAYIKADMSFSDKGKKRAELLLAKLKEIKNIDDRAGKETYLIIMTAIQDSAIFRSLSARLKNKLLDGLVSVVKENYSYTEETGTRSTALEYSQLYQEVVSGEQFNKENILKYLKDVENFNFNVAPIDPNKNVRKDGFDRDHKYFYANTNGREYVSYFFHGPTSGFDSSPTRCEYTLTFNKALYLRDRINGAAITLGKSADFDKRVQELTAEIDAGAKKSVNNSGFFNFPVLARFLSAVTSEHKPRMQ